MPLKTGESWKFICSICGRITTSKLDVEYGEGGKLWCVTCQTWPYHRINKIQDSDLKRVDGPRAELKKG